jgi:hypothetical protein
MGDLTTRASSLERQIILIARELNEKKDEVAGLAGAIKYIAEQAEKMEEENAKMRKEMEDIKKEYEKKLSDAMKK